jgi:membrane associated rhomboid family serine protease
LKKKNAFERLISLLQGASWALVLIGAVSFFTTFYNFGIITALIAAFIGSLGGLFFVVLFEIANIQIEKLEEIKKQTKLLEKLVELND